MQSLADKSQSVAALRCGRRCPHSGFAYWNTEGELSFQFCTRPIHDVSWPHERIPLWCDTQEVQHWDFCILRFAKPSIVGRIGIGSHEGVINQLVPALNLRLHLPLVVVPAASAANR